MLHRHHSRDDTSFTSTGVFQLHISNLLLVSMIPSFCHFTPIFRNIFIFKLKFFFKSKYFSKSFLKFNAINEILVKITISSWCHKNDQNLPNPSICNKIFLSFYTLFDLCSLLCLVVTSSEKAVSFPLHCTALKTRFTVNKQSSRLW